MNMSLLEIIFTTTDTSTTTGQFIAFLITGIFFAGLTGLFIFLYFKLNSTANALKQRSAHKSGWSFAGFWGENRQKIIAFLAGLFLLLSISFLSFAIGFPPPQAS